MEWCHVQVIEIKDKSHLHKYCKHVFVAASKYFLYITPAYG